MSRFSLAVFERESLRVATEEQVARQRQLAREFSHDENEPLLVTEAEASALVKLNSVQRGFCVREGEHIALSMHCGLVRLPSGRLGDGVSPKSGTEVTTLEILPKVWGGMGDARVNAAGLAGTGSRPERLARARRALLRLLQCGENLPISPIDVAPQASDRAPLLDLFIRSFLREALRVAKGGLLTRYVETVDDQSVLRGRLLLVESERLAASRPGLWRCERDDLSLDNPYNQALLAAIERCRPHLRKRSTERLWLEARAFFSDVSLVRIDAESVAKLKRARETTRYNEALRWAQLLLDLLSPSLAAGSSPAPALLFNMETLFEHWVARHERANAPEGIAVQLKGAVRCLATIGPTINAPSGSGRATQAFRLMPDVQLWSEKTDRRAGSPQAIVDAKWKQLRPARPDWGVDESDVRQVLAYMIRFGCRQAKLAYPILSGAELPPEGPPTFWISLNCGETASVEVALVPIDA